MAQEPQIPFNSRNLRIRFQGVSRTFDLLVGGDDFTDNNEQPARVVAKSRGAVYAVIDGDDPDAITGSFTAPLLTENNANAEAFLDVIRGLNDWANQGTGAVGSPYVQTYCLTMEITRTGVQGAGGDTVVTYSKTRFEFSEAMSADMSTVSVNWFCVGGRVAAGPGAA